MGHTLKSLASEQVASKAVFNNRFVVEICEKVHVHYRNLRILMDTKDWIEMATGMKNALDRWQKIGSPEPSHGTHIELCRKSVASNPLGTDSVTINLNQNLYPNHEDRIFSEGADFEEPKYIHLKIRDLRIEMSLSDFDSLSKAVDKAKETLCQES